MPAIDDSKKREELARLLALGMDVTSACAQSETPKVSLYRWLNEAPDIFENVPEKDRNLHQRQVVKWFKAYHEALGTFKETLLRHAMIHSASDWKATEKLLKSHMGELYGEDKVQVEVQGTVTAEHVLPDMTDDDNMRKFWQARAEMGDKKAKRLLEAVEEE